MYCAYGKKGWRLCIGLHGNPSQSYRASPAICDHTVLPATRHTVYLPKRDGTLSWPGWLVIIPRWFSCPQTVFRPGTNHLIVTQPGVETTTSWSQVGHPTISLQSHVMRMCKYWLELTCVGVWFHGHCGQLTDADDCWHCEYSYCYCCCCCYCCLNARYCVLYTVQRH